MEKKLSEHEFKDFCKKQGIYSHKFADILKCPRCFETIWQSSNVPDFEITYLGLKTLVEVKQGSGEYGAWNFANDKSGITENQRNALDNWLNEQAVMPWLFLVLGSGRAPLGRGAFLIPWTDWQVIEKELLTSGQKSIRFEGGRKITAKEKLARYQLIWEKSTDEHPAGWELPRLRGALHPFYAYLNTAWAGYARRILTLKSPPINVFLEVQ